MSKGPYAPTTWGLGGTAKKNIDVPITAVFIALFILCGMTHSTILRRNNKRGHKFWCSAAMFGFSGSRVVSCVLRIASICTPKNLNLAIAANILVGFGVVFLFIVNIILAQRILRATHPKIGWHRAIKPFFTGLYVLIVLTMAMSITATVQNFFTLRPRTKYIDRALQLYGQTMLGIISSIPIFIVLLALAIPRKTRTEQFGAGTLRSKIIILLTGSFLLALGAWYRCATMWITPVQKTEPLPGYFSRPCFYIFYFVVELLTVVLYAVTRVDLRFYVPDGAKGPGDYEMRKETSPVDEEDGDSTSMAALRANKEG